MSLDDFTLFEFRDKDGKSLVKKIAKTPLLELRKWMGTIGKMDIALIWAIENDEDDYREFLGFYNFGNDTNLKKEKNQFITRYNTAVKKQRKATKSFKEFKKKVTKGVEKFKKDTTLSDFASTKTTVLAEFDADDLLLDPTENIPMFKTAYWTKLWRQYTDMNAIKNFFAQTSDRYLFRIPGEEIGYIDINTEHIEFTVKPEKIDDTIDILNRDLEANIIDYSLLKINGSFVVKDFYFDRNIIAMMLVENLFYDNRLFLNETGEVLSKKVKLDTQDDIKSIGRFQLTYYKHGPEFSSPIFITFTNRDKDIIVSIAKIPNEADIKDAVNMAIFILQEYATKEDKIEKVYKRGVPDFKIKTVKKQTVQKQKKTKLRINQLRTFDPDLFGREYPRMCQGPKQQPIIATKDQIKKLKGTDKIVEYPFGSGKYYTCVDDSRPFPGLLENRKDDNPKYKYVPCCYPRSQEKRIAKFQAEEAGLVPKKVVVKDYIFEGEKVLDEGRQGKLSDVLQKILKYHHLDPDTFIRYGVTQSPQSILYAMAMIEDYDGWVKNPEKAKKKVIEKLQDSHMLNAALQSYSRDYLDRALEKDDMEIKPKNFHPVLEYYFKAVVVVIDNNDLARPDSYFGFIPRIRKRKNLIILYTHKDSEQVEVIGMYDKSFIFERRRSINQFLKSKKQVYGFFSGKDYKMPKVSKISRFASAQYVDSYGKARGFLINGQSIFTIPTAPMAKRVIKKAKVKNAEVLMNELDIEPLYYESGIVYTDKFVVPTNEMYNLDAPPSDFIKPYILSLSDFVEKSATSENNAHEILRGDKAVPRDLKKEVKQFKKSGIRLPPLDKIEISSPKVITLYDADDEEDYLESLKVRPLFKWQKLWKLEHVPGKIHWVIADENKSFMVKDVDDVPDGEVAYDVVADAKVGDGDVVVYKQSESFIDKEDDGDLYGVIEN